MRTAAELTHDFGASLCPPCISAISAGAPPCLPWDCEGSEGWALWVPHPACPACPEFRREPRRALL